MQTDARRWLVPAAILALSAAEAALAQGNQPPPGQPTPVAHNEQGRTASPTTLGGSVRVSAPRITAPCFANCDRSTTPPLLNVADFACFLNTFAAGDLSANCDESTAQPVLNVMDFACFLNRFTAGCS